MKIESLITSFATIFITCNGHMQMMYPPPRGDIHNSLTGPPDYDSSSPLSSAVMCKGKKPRTAQAVFRAGQVVPVRFHGSARHGGGMCQFAISYDGDRSFIVIETIHGACPDKNYTWPVKLPANLPNCSRCTFAWTWINAIGNREYYMNCADVRIIGGRGKGISGTLLYLANLPGYRIEQPKVKDGGPQASRFTYYPVYPF